MEQRPKHVAVASQATIGISRAKRAVSPVLRASTARARTLRSQSQFRAWHALLGNTKAWQAAKHVFLVLLVSTNTASQTTQSRRRATIAHKANIKTRQDSGTAKTVQEANIRTRCVKQHAWTARQAISRI